MRKRNITPPFKATPFLMTPEIAKRDFETRQGFGKNYRRMDVERRREYARQMTAGLWKPGVATVVIARDGYLMNGQHFCGAVIDSGTSQWCILITGLSPDCNTGFDKGQPRQAAQYLASLGYKYPGARAAAIRRIEMWRRNQKLWGYAIFMADDEVEKMANATCREMDMVIPLGAQFARRGLSTTTNILFLHHVLSRLNGVTQDQVDRFFELVLSGDGDSEASTRVLHERLSQERIKAKRGSTFGYVKETQLFFLAWNCYIMQQPLRRLSLPRNGEFPEPYGPKRGKTRKSKGQTKC